MHKFQITNAEGGTALLVKIKADADANRIIGKDDDIVHIELATPEGDDINEELATLVANKLDIKRERIAIAFGSGLEKMIIIMGLTPEIIEERLTS